MQFLKFSALFFIFTNSFAFTGTECFKSSFDVSVSHKSAPFGLLSKTITISKRECELEVKHNEYKYLNKSWIIDICRDPIHIKDTSTSMDVYRKEGECNSTSNDFCNEYKTIRKITEDDGLIFAQGAKNNLDVDHGKIFCAKLLLDGYLNYNIIFNRDGNYDSLLNQKPVALAIPKVENKEVKKNKPVVVEEEQPATSTDTQLQDTEAFKIDENAGPGTF